ncbi:BREX system P-loop protein BrxC [Actinacidiphila sp. ITFR-21]|uniref:BREX system P-loop protein BrxC n=1 Tax=Actinacidiphila sp. ITFR-21 TaxID=3075199 RepID=UPI002889F598|nr:BREX system P-loop protein BrxC [Streptomyces sp. ITFR-21]WNI14280.1 BREX system P-loop protein BrxC [Streptomyces sp. ITFR-21]
MTLNRELFVEDPTDKDIPNLGVSKVGRPADAKEWEVLRYELSSFVCEGEYENGLDLVLGTYLRHLGQAQQPAVWVSGFYGSGKSHLARVLEFLWQDVRLPDGASTRELVDFTPRIGESLRELSTAAERAGGLWSVSGMLGSGAGESVRLAFLSVLLRGAGLPEKLAPARCAIWLHKEGIHAAVREYVERHGGDFRQELHNLYVARLLPLAVLDALPGFADSAAEVRKQLREQFPERADISDDEMLTVLGDVLGLMSTRPGRIPCTLVVLDEMQQFISEDPERALGVQNLVELCSAKFQSRLLIVATGQSALQATATLQKLTDRFSVQIQLSNTDVDSVIRKVALRKRADRIGELESTLGRVSGEIDRQLSGSRIAAAPGDGPDLVPDYPLLPSRRRFWEQVLRAVDKGGKAGQLRTQLRAVHEANRHVARSAVGTVVPADFIYGQQSSGMLQSRVLLREVEELIQNERKQGPDGELRSRVLALVFLIAQLSREGFTDTGVRATAEHIADLLVDDLTGAGDRLRRDVPRLLEELRAESKLQRVDDEYRLQTRAGQEWTRDFQARLYAFLSDAGRVAAARDKELRDAVGRLVQRGTTQGVSRTQRTVSAHFGDTAPAVGADVPVWVRDGWDVTGKQFTDEATGAGQDSPLVFVHLPKHEPDALRQALGELRSAQETLDARARPTTDEGLAAQRAMQSTRDSARERVDALVGEVVRGGFVVQAGGNRVAGSDLRNALAAATERALDRMYPKFGDGDHTGWGTVVSRAQQGNTDALAAVGYSGDAAGHPVCKAVRDAVPGTGATGLELRRRFESSPYGWPRDAVHGALLVLLLAGEITAEDSGTPVTARDITPTRIGKLSFRREGASLALPQRLGVRQVLTRAEVPFRNNEEAAGCAALLDRLGELAQAAGGSAPLPPVPSADSVRELRTRRGNDLVVGVFERREALLAEIEEWTRRASLRQPRLDAFRQARSLAAHARDLPAAASVVGRLEAVSAGRLLLDRVDPVGPVVQELTALLRAEVGSRAERHDTALREALDELGADETWRAAGADQQQAVLAGTGLVPVAAADLSGPAAVLAALDRESLSSWENRIVSVRVRLQQAREKAARLAEPTAFRIDPPPATLRSTEDVDRYVERLRAVLTAALDEHGSLIL